MGAFMKEHDVFVGHLQEQLNLRFAPNLGKSKQHGLAEMIKLQSEFGIFKEGRSFESSIAALNLAGQNHQEVKERFHGYLRSLRRAKSNLSGLNGDQAIVKSLVQNLAAKKPLPVYFELHDMNGADGGNRVLITGAARPLFYMKQDYMVVSLPLGADDGKPAAKAKPKAKAKAK
ncbi:hypothetical protein GCM10027034_39770 [Ramlibacter solisilvae]|uniref:Uncharacterized protein n=1 Tax=Ramlibacter tataouinensis TaxID=94132 RepID=A0A127JU60_9BURK|nr:hypothetical protein [Ramlibacter tataouinensis]AMO23511.1 hypothetical protein UC35_12185 [Ramlibacter tataouinensis]